MVNDLFSRDELQPARDDIEQLVEDLAQKLYKHGKITSMLNFEPLKIIQRITMAVSTHVSRGVA